jgi:xanthine dehydrogenase accessory factor
MLNPCFKNIRILIKGGGDLATGVATRLYHAGFPLVMTETPTPTMIRRAVSFGSAIYEGQITVEGVTAIKSTLAEVEDHINQGRIPVIIDPAGKTAARWSPVVLIDAIMAKSNTGVRLSDAPLVIGLGPGFHAGQDCHFVIETSRGHRLGRIISAGAALPNTGVPGSIEGKTSNRVLRAPSIGYLIPYAAIGDRVKGGEVIAVVGEQPVVAPFDGVVRGLVHPSVPLTPGFKIGDVDPRGIPEHCFTISEKSFALGGGVLQVILASKVVREKMPCQ